MITLSESAEEVLNNCVSRFDNVTVIKMRVEQSESLRVVLCSTQKEKLSEVLHVLREDLSEDVLDLNQAEVTQCPLSMRTVSTKKETVVSLRLICKWGSEAILLDSKEFVAIADSSADGACIPEVNLIGKINLLLYSFSLGQLNMRLSLTRCCTQIK